MSSFKRHADLAPEKSAVPWEATERHSQFRHRKPCPTGGIALGGPEITPAGTFPSALPSRIERRLIRLAFLESHLQRWF